MTFSCGEKNTSSRGHFKPKLIVKWPIFPCEEAQAPLQAKKKTGGSKSRDENNDDAEVRFVGVEHVNEDSEAVFVRVSSSSKPIFFNI